MKPHLARRLEALRDMDGWCTPEKAHAMADLILETGPAMSVEIGVFGGRSLVAQAMALQEMHGGLVYGIDPWARGPCVEGVSEPENEKWWAEVDIVGVHRRCMEAIGAHNLWDVVRVVALPSYRVSDSWGPASIDILHIDGNHTKEVSTLDVRNYLPKVRPGGHVWMDDTDWPTTAEAVAMLDAQCTRVKQVDNCVLFKLSQERQ